MERAFFDYLDIPHLSREGDGWESAWEDVLAHLEEDDPVLVFLDPASLPYLPDPVHLPPHPALVVGHDGDTAVLSDGAREGLQEVSLAGLGEAWTSDRLAAQTAYLVVTRSRILADEREAATSALHETAQYVLHPLDAPHGRGGPGEEGIAALRDFAADVPGWADLPEPTVPVRDALASIEWHGEGAALRGLYADALDELAPRAGLAGGKGDHVRDIAEEWRTATDRLNEVLETDDAGTRERILEEAGSLLGDIADREEAFFERLAAEI